MTWKQIALCYVVGSLAASGFGWLSYLLERPSREHTVCMVLGVAFEVAAVLGLLLALVAFCWMCFNLGVGD